MKRNLALNNLHKVAVFAAVVTITLALPGSGVYQIDIRIPSYFERESSFDQNSGFNN